MLLTGHEHYLEQSLYLLAEAVTADEISQLELVDTLARLSVLSKTYAPEGGKERKPIQHLHDKLMRKYVHLFHTAHGSK